MRLAFVALPLMLLAGCGSQEPANEAANVAVELPKGPMLGDLDLSQPLLASGTGPVWAMDLAPGRIALTEGRGGKVRDFYPVSPKVEDDRAVYASETPEGEPVTVTLTRAKCLRAGPEEASFPLSAEVKIGSRVLRGCAGLKPAAPIADPVASAPANAAG